MILKSLDGIVLDDKFSRAGYNAEKQMEFYLNRAFANHGSILVLNGIRIKYNNEVCQIDHLVVHDYGMFIVESKSVTSKVKINEDGSWERFWGAQSTGMPSPVLQAERQGKLLREFLDAHKEELLSKRLGIQRTFERMPIKIIVAISDKGKIGRSKHSENEFVLKADQVPGRIEEVYNEQKKLDHPLSLSLKLPDWLTSKETAPRVADFLLANHLPSETVVAPKNTANSKVEYLQQEKVKEEPKVQEEQKIYATDICPECHSKASILWGNKQKNYYWHCNDCGKNTAIKYNCPGCKGRLKIKKDNQNYFIYCEPCKLEALYHTEAKD